MAKTKTEQESSLVIVESPAKARTLKRYLGNGYQVEASVGHIKDLPKRELGVDIEDQFKPQYKLIPGKGEIVKRIKKAAIDATTVFLAADPDREGEAIAWHIAEEICKTSNANIQRVLIHEITKHGVAEALAHPRALDQDKYNAQQARRVLDRLVGYRISPLLWERVRRGLSAGRVQSVALRLICDREREIAAFVAKEYWTIQAQLQAANPPAFLAKLIRIGKEKAEVSDGATAARIVDELKAGSFTVSGVTMREKQRQPVPPFTTSTLQQESFRKLRFATQRTMRVAQQLYEGLPLGDEGPVGLITYMRTDSTRVSDQAVEAVRALVSDRYGKAYVPERPRSYRNAKSAQDAHEAIRPTDVTRSPESLRGQLTDEQERLYDLVWKRFVASQMANALFDATNIDIANGIYGLRATGSILRFEGFLKVYNVSRDTDEVRRADASDAESDDKDLILPVVSSGETLRLRKLEPEQHFTQPPPRYNEASLVKELEQLGIGRPSTYATIMAKIQDRSYTMKEKGRFSPTPLGFTVTDLLVESFPAILDVRFTADMEENLDGVEEGTRDWHELISRFYQAFVLDLEAAKKGARVKILTEETDLPCPSCGKKLVVKWGTKGEFLACEGYPECRFTADFQRAPDGKPVPRLPEEVDKICDQCGSKMILRTGRFGSFLACSAYPKCKNTVSAYKDGAGQVQTGFRELERPCPKCGGTLLVRTGKRGPFVGCRNYPKCKHTENLDKRESAADSTLEKSVNQ
ncbi:MAG: type I DNA topoisomerase [Candidatus Schekmanbacteria bacterium]|nr:type I DNA topoisomerase [Candidatus Schekmanbacteria bacterium]